MTVEAQRLEAATAGDPEAMIEVILAEGPALRLFIAAHVESSAVVPELEQAIWATIRRQLPRREVSVPVAEWLRWIATAPLARHLQTVAQQDGESLIRLLVEECQAALSDARDQGAAGVTARLQALSSEQRALLHHRYGGGESLERLATRYLSGPDAVAAQLVAARASCDWRDGDHPRMGDRLLPRLLEDWFAGVLDPASHELLSAQVANGGAQAAAIVRQVRLHLTLTIAHQLFTREEATALARLSAKQAEGRDASSYRGRAATRGSAIEPRRASRIASHPRIEQARPSSSSSLPLILGGVVVIAIALLVVVMNRTAPRPADGPRPPLTVERPAPSAPASVSAGTVRPEPGRSAGPVPGAGSDAPLTISLSGEVLSGTAHAGRPLLLAITANRPELLGAVEYRIGDRLLATMTRPPFSWEWRDPAAITGELSVRALAKDGALLTTIAAPLRILPAQATGAILREWWGDLPGRQVADGLKGSSYPDRPRGATFETSFASRRDWSDNYLQRMRGHLVPPVDGAYTFWISADDEAELWLSTDETPTARRRIAVCPATDKPAVSYGKWDDRPQQRSEPVMLQAGRRYHIEAVHKENAGGDHLAVGWQLPDGTMERPIPGKHLMPPGTPDDGVLVFATGLEEVAVGQPPPHFTLIFDPAVPAATAIVVEGDAAEGRRHLAFTEVPGQKGPWMPQVRRSVDFQSGRMRTSFMLRIRAGASLSHEWRQLRADKSVIHGPMVEISGNGTVLVQEREVTRIPMDTWVRFTITGALGAHADGTWTLVVQPQGGTAEEFTKLPCNSKFVHLQWWSFSSRGDITSVSDLDDVTMHLMP